MRWKVSDSEAGGKGRCGEVIRAARVDDVGAMRELINGYAERGRMLFRSLADLYASVRDFVVCEEAGVVVGCCALQVYWADLAEIKSLAVREDVKGRGVGRALAEAALAEARGLRVRRVFTLTLEAGFFERIGLEKVATESLPLKVWSDCVNCPKQNACDEIAMAIDIEVEELQSSQEEKR